MIKILLFVCISFSYCLANKNKQSTNNNTKGKKKVQTKDKKTQKKKKKTERTWSKNFTHIDEDKKSTVIRLYVYFSRYFLYVRKVIFDSTNTKRTHSDYIRFIQFLSLFKNRNTLHVNSFHNRYIHMLILSA